MPHAAPCTCDGEKGTLYITTLYKLTTLYKWGAPQIRFNVNDISAYATDTCACGSTMRRLQCIYVRADNMVKLRGVNVFPEAVGAVVVEDARSNGEYFCVVERVGEAGTDEMMVMVEARDTSVDTQTLKTDLERRMKEVLGIRVAVEVHGSGVDSHTGTSKTSKVKRLADRR